MTNTYTTPQPYGHKVTSDASLEPVSMADMRFHLRLDDTIEDVYLNSLVKAARKNIEAQINRKMINQTLTLTCDSFPAGDWELPFSPVNSITSIVYRNTSGANITLTGYTLRNSAQPNLPAVIQQPSIGWPATDGYTGAITVTMVCGYGATVANVPEGLVLAVKLLASNYYENRNAVNERNTYTIPMHIESLISEHKFFAARI